MRKLVVDLYQVEFYEDARGVSELWNFLEELEQKAENSKDARIQYRQIAQCIDLLQKNGTFLGNKITKHIIEDIWELRPGFNRIFYFYYKEDTFVLLHQFRKKSNKTPKREIEKALSERDDYLARKESEHS